jgi:hypothetical protein
MMHFNADYSRTAKQVRVGGNPMVGRYGADRDPLRARKELQSKAFPARVGTSRQPCARRAHFRGAVSSMTGAYSRPVAFTLPVGMTDFTLTGAHAAGNTVPSAPQVNVLPLASSTVSDSRGTASRGDAACVLEGRAASLIPLWARSRRTAVPYSHPR